MSSKAYVCERCGGVATICHHRKHLTATNITDPNIALGWDNLEALCQECHNLEHQLRNNLTYFNEDGSISKVKDCGTIKEFKKAQQDIDNLLNKIKTTSI